MRAYESYARREPIMAQEYLKSVKGANMLVVLLNQTFTEKVNMSIGKKIAKTIGYRKIEKNIRPIFENLRKELKP